MKSIRSLLGLVPVLLGLLILTAMAVVFLIRIERVIEARGEVGLGRYQQVRPSVPGLVSRVLVEPGDTVRADEVLIELEDPEAREELASVEHRLADTAAALADGRQQREVLAESIPLETRQWHSRSRRQSLESRRLAVRVEELQVRLDSFRRREQRARELFEAGLVSQEQLEEARNETREVEAIYQQSELAAASAREETAAFRESRQLLEAEHASKRIELDSTVSQLEQQRLGLLSRRRHLQERLASLSLRATIDGVVVGSWPRDLLGRQPEVGEAVLTVVDVEAIFFEGYVPEETIVRVKEGQSAYVEILGLPKHRFEIFRGAVKEVSLQPDLDRSDGRIFYPVRLALDRPWITFEGQRFYLRDGMRGRARIVYRSRARIARVLWDILLDR